MVNARNPESKEGSPSEMFTGIEQPLPSNQDWVYQDSMHFADGFENWTGMDLDPSWTNGVFPNNVSMGGGMMVSTTTAQMSVPDAQAPVFANEGIDLNDYTGAE